MLVFIFNDRILANTGWGIYSGPHNKMYEKKMNNLFVVFMSVATFVAALNINASAVGQTGYLGSNACKPCHEDVYETWKTSKHSGIFKPEQDSSSNCVACHSTGTDLLKQSFTENVVGCESCHGPGEGHASTGDPEKIVSINSADICGRCHSRYQSGEDMTAMAEYKPGMKLSEIKGLKLIHVSSGKLPPSGKDVHPSMTYNMWLASGHAETPARNIEINNKKWIGPVTCVACHNPHGSDNSSQLIMKRDKICNECHFQVDVQKGYGAKGIEETRNLHTPTPCFTCHMTEKNHLMKVFRPDDPDLSDNRMDSCTHCHRVGSREMRAKQIQDMEEWYNEAMEPVQRDLKYIEEKLKNNPGILNMELKSKLEDVKSNLSIILNDGSNGVHNLDYALEIMTLAKRHLKEIKNAVQ